MEISRDVSKVFVPVVLTLTSQMEVDYLTGLVAASHGSIDEALGIDAMVSFDMYEMLEQYSSPSRPKNIIEMRVIQ